MPSTRLRHPARRLALVAAGLLTIALAAGCVTIAIAPATIEPESEARTQTMPDGWVLVARYGRYTLVELAPEAA